MQYTCKYLSPLGEMLLASDGEALTGAWFEGQKYYAAALAVAHEEKSLPVFEETRTWLDGYFNGRKPGFMPLIHLQGSPFRWLCWRYVAKDSLRRNGHLSRLGFGNSPEAWNTEHVGAGCRRSRGA